jgi:hypothetical protein
VRSIRLIAGTALLASASAGLAAAGNAKYYVVLSDVMGASATNFAGPYPSKAACQSDATAFQAKATSPVEAYICVPLQKAAIDKISAEDKQGLEKNKLNTK